MINAMRILICETDFLFSLFALDFDRIYNIMAIFLID